MPDSPPPPPPLPHSAEYFGEDRDHWWDPDFVAFLFRSWNLGAPAPRQVLDVGCGIGHWGRVLLPHLPADAHLTGIDREPEWVAKSQSIAAAKGLSPRTHYIQGAAESTPFPDNTFDLVTCQTLLIHVPDRAAVVREMIRVLKPGGCLLVVEPNNLAATQAVGSPRFNEPIEQRLAITRFQILCERGKEALGEGNNSCGELIPGLFAEHGLYNIKVCQSSRASALIPPYDSPAQQALRNQILDWSTRDFWIWSKPDTARYHLAGGGTLAEFETLWSLAMKLAKEEAEALRNNTYHGAGGGICYIIAGWKVVV